MERGYFNTEMHRLEVRIWEGRHLSKHNNINSYVKIKVGPTPSDVHTRAKTRCCKHTSSPVWDEVFTVELESHTPSALYLVFNVLDNGVFHDTNLGTYVFPLELLCREVPWEEWVILTTGRCVSMSGKALNLSFGHTSTGHNDDKMDGVDRPELHVRVLAVGFGKEREDAEAAETGSALIAKIPVTPPPAAALPVKSKTMRT